MKYQVIIIGGGPAGYTAAESAGKAGLSVLLIVGSKEIIPSGMFTDLLSTVVFSMSAGVRHCGIPTI